jgi:hypothetical protein
MKYLVLAVLAACLAAVTTGCSGEQAPTPDGRGESAVSAESSAGERTADATYATTVQPLFDAHCASEQCHGAEEDGGLRLTPDVSYGELVNVPSMQMPSVMRVLPADPDSSYLIIKMGDSPPLGNRMPLGQAPLSPADVEAIRNWIAEGAPKG